MKQYKNGIKFANQIISKPKFADHGETLAMKGLILMCMGRRDDSLDLVRRGLRNDLQSHVCWHVYGLVQRAMHKYDEAIKAYRNALRWEKDNVQILRDLSLLQVQMRDIEGYKDTRYQLLAVRPSQKASWLCYAVSLHMLGDYKTAIKVLEEYKKTLDVKDVDFEFSELLMYIASIYEESGRLTDTLDFLVKNESKICDVASLMELKGKLLMEIPGKTNEAKRVYETLLERNPENKLYSDKLAQIITGTSLLDPNAANSVVKLEPFLGELIARYPKSSTIQLLSLKALPSTSALFEKILLKYLKDGIDKNIPPLFVTMRPLYSDAGKRAMIERIVNGFVNELTTSGQFSKDQQQDKPEPPTTLVWALYYLAQHYDICGNYDKALEVMKKAIDIVPTLPDLLLGMARLCKHAGNISAATSWADEAQSLDTADRYLNYKCARYMLRQGRIEEADNLLAKFTKPSNGDTSAASALNEMQCMWFLIEVAASYRRQGKIGDALKKCHEIERHFSQMYEDQFDFHTYCPRKMTLRAYVKLVQLTDTQHRHRFFIRSAQLAAGIYLDLADDPQFNERLNEKSEDTENMSGLSEKERKKLKSKQRKQMAKEQAEKGGDKENEKEKDKNEDAVAQVSSSFASLGLDGNATLDTDKLAKPDNALEIATNYIRPLVDSGDDLLEAQLLAFECYWRKGFILRMLKAVKKAVKCSSMDEPRVHFCVVRLLNWLDQNYSKIGNAIVKKVVDTQLESLFGKKPMSSSEYNEQWIKNCGGVEKVSVEQAIAYARSIYQMDPSTSSRDRALQAISKKLDAAVKNNEANVSFKTCSNLYSALCSGNAPFIFFCFTKKLLLQYFILLGRRSGAGW